MKLGTYADGRDLNYNETTQQFDVGGAPVTAEQVQAYDGAGQVAWLSPEVKSWFDGALPALTAAAAPAPAPTAPQPSVAAPAYAPTASSYPLGGASPVPGSATAATGTPWFKQWWVWAIAAVLLVVFVIGGFGLVKAMSQPKNGGPVIINPPDDPQKRPEDNKDQKERKNPEDREPAEYTAEEREYFQACADLLYQFADSWQALGQLSQENPGALRVEGDAQDQAIRHCEDIIDIWNKVIELEPPAGYEEEHEAFKAMWDSISDGAIALVDGLLEDDPDEWQRGLDLVMAGVEAMPSAAAFVPDEYERN